MDGLGVKAHENGFTEFWCLMINLFLIYEERNAGYRLKTQANKKKIKKNTKISIDRQLKPKFVVIEN